MTSLLLDTRIALWLASEPDRLSDSSRALVDDPRTDLLFSSASAWEIAIKYAAEKLALPAPPSEFLPELQRRLRLTAVPIDVGHAVRAAALPMLHRDPFDRMLVAQAQALGVPIMSVDGAIGRYEVEVVGV